MKQMMRLAFAFLVLLTSLAWGNDKEKLLRRELEGRVFLLRGTPTDEVLQFDTKFMPVSERHAGPWTDAVLAVNKVDVKDDHIKIRGYTMGFVEDNQTPGHKVEIEIQDPYLRKPEDLLQQIKEHIFVSEPKDFDPAIPQRWQEVFSGKSDVAVKGQFAGFMRDGTVVYRIWHTAATAPRPIYSPDPEMADKKGLVVLVGVILPDGTITELHVARTLSADADNKAIQAVKTWRFKPATLDEKPVPVRINIEVSFN